MEKDRRLYYAKWALIWFCVVAIVASFALNRIENSGQDTRITRVEPACLRYGPESKECHESFGAAIKSITKPQLCEALAVVELRPPACRN